MIESRDPYQVWDGEKFQFTLNKICRIIYGRDDFALPEALRPIADEPVARVMADNMPNTSGVRVVFDLSWDVPPKESAEKMCGFLQKGIIVVTNRKFKNAGRQPYPVISVEDPWEAWVALGQYVKEIFPMPTIGITGSAGKTTSTEFARCVFDERYKTFVSGLDGRNYNSPLQIVNQWLLRAGPDYTFHVQECGAMTKGLIESSARIINADAFGITNIDTSQHIAAYETAENLIADKTSFDRFRKENTFAVINLDDEILRSFPFQSPVITFAIENENADYVAKNIVQNGKFLEFDIIGRSDSVHIQIHIIGKHNVYNALMVFALAKEFGLANEEIQRGFLKYESVGIRQNIREVGGRIIYMDSYNASVVSTQLSIQAMEGLVLPHGSKRIAVIGERMTSNEETYEINYELGKALAQYKKIDEYIIVGKSPAWYIGPNEKIDPKNEKRYSTALYDGLCSVIGEDIRVSFCRDYMALATRLRYQTKAGDAILFKGMRYLALWCISDIAFGTAYTKSQAVVPLAIKKRIVSTKSIKGEDYQHFNGINLTSVTNGIDNTKIVLPSLVNNRPIVRIGDRAFAQKTQLKHIVFGIRIRAIGDGAFFNCTNIEQLELPKSCLHIGENAFEGCSHMVRASLPGVAHISKEAFKGCASLRQVLLTEKCATIEKDAFADCHRLTICAPEGSYAAHWAEKNGIRWEAVDTEEELAKLARNGTRLRPNVYGLGRFEPEEAGRAAPAPADGNRTDISVVVAGDIMAHDELLAASLDKETGVYDFSKLFANTKKYFKSADMAIGNMETVLGPGAYRGFPIFNSPAELGEAMAQAGFDIAACANNHILDNKCAGVVRTARVLQSMGMAVAGIRDSEDKKAYALVERNGVKIALINFTYLTSALGGEKVMNNRHTVDDASDKLINTFCFETLDKDLDKVRAEIESARDEGADIVLVYYHWGAEYERKANILQKYMAYQTAKMGADAIFGSHAHILQEMGHVAVTVDGKERAVPVFYGLGNYCWSARLSRTGRETVQNGALARLNIVFDKASRQTVSIEMDYVPLYIKVDYIYNKYDVNVLSLRDMSMEETKAFNLRSSKSAAEIMEDIGQTLRGGRHSAAADLRFDTVLELPVGGRVSVIGNIVSKDEFAALRSENAPVASALQNGEIIGNAPGFAGMAVTAPDGREISFVVNVTGTGVGDVPVVVDGCNKVPDIYCPRDLVSDKQYSLPGGYSLRKDAAEAWHNMRLAARESGIYFRCVSAYRSMEGQLSRIVAYEVNRDANAELPAPKPVGFSEHHLGTSLDVSNVRTGDKQSTLEEVSKWLENNAYLFGFVLRPSVADQPRHLRYVGDPAAAELIQNEGVDIAQYAAEYPDYQERICEVQRWKTRYLTPEEAAEPMERWTKLTLRRICRIIGIEVPMVYRDIQDRVVPKVTLSDIDVAPGSIFFRNEKLKSFMSRARSALRKGAVLEVTQSSLLGDKLPQIVVGDAYAAASAVGAFIRRQYMGKVICTAEKGGQRVLRDAMYMALANRCHIFANMRSDLRPVDKWLSVLDTIQNIPPESEIYLQSIQGVYPAYMKQTAKMLRPDIAVCAVIPETFPKAYGQLDAYREDYLSVLDVTLENGGTVFVNVDEPLLETYAKLPSVVTFSASSGMADYCLTHSEYANGVLELHIRRKGESKDFIRYLESGNVPVYGLAVCAVKDWLAARGEFKQGLWQERDGKRCYVDENGVSRTGFVEADGKLYYLDPQDGSVRRDCWLDVEDKRYRLSSQDGAVLTGLNVIGDKTYYLSYGDGHMLKGCFITIGEDRYHLADDGSMEKDRSIAVDNKTYYLDTDGRVMRGCLVEADGKRFYLNEKDGHVMKGGWVKAKNGRQYYLSSDDGYVIRNWRKWLVKKAKGMLKIMREPFMRK